MERQRAARFCRALPGPVHFPQPQSAPQRQLSPQPQAEALPPQLEAGVQAHWPHRQFFSQ